MLKELFKDGVIYSVSTIITRGLTLLLIPLYTRVLSPAEYGAFDLFLAFSNLVQIVVALEVSQAIARFSMSESSSERRISYASTGLLFSILAYSIVCITAFYYSERLARLVMGSKDLDYTFQLGMVYIWIYNIFYLLQNQFRWEMKSKLFAFSSMLVSVTTLTFSIIFTYFMNLELNGLFYSLILSFSVGLCYGFFHLRNCFRFKLQFAYLKEMLAFSIPLVPSSVSVVISLFADRWLIGYFGSIHDVGLYSVALRISGVVGITITGFQMALTPLIYKYYKDTKTPKNIAEIFRLFIAFALLTYLLIVLFANTIMGMLVADDFYDSRKLLIILVPAILLSQMYIFAPGMGIAKKTSVILVINLLGAIFNVVSNVILIPIYGVYGAGVATLASYIFVFISYMNHSQRYYFVPHCWSRILSITFFVVIIVVTSSFLEAKGVKHTWLDAAFFITVLMLMFTIQIIKRSDMRVVFDFLIKKIKKY